MQNAFTETPVLQEDFAELREALAGERKEASAAQAASAAELQSVRRQHKAAVQVSCRTDHVHNLTIIYTLGSGLSSHCMCSL